MKLSELAMLLPGSERRGASDPEIHGITHDSRRVKPGDLFVCVTGQKSDGHQFLGAAVERGAVAGLVERVEERSVSVPWLRVPSTRATDEPSASPDTPAKEEAASRHTAEAAVS